MPLLSPACRPAARQHRGFTLASISLLITVIMGFGLTLTTIIVQGNQTSRVYQELIAASNLADAGISKALYCLNATSGERCSGQYGDSYTGEDAIDLSPGGFSVIVSGSGDTRTLTAFGVTDTGQTTTVKLEAEKLPGGYTDTQFDYSVMIKNYIHLTNNASILGGPLYSDVDVVCANNTDLTADIYVTKVNGEINNCDIVGDAHADQITNRTNTTGHCYWRTQLDGNTDCATGDTDGQSTPPAQTLPYFDTAYWQGEAVAGGSYDGDYEATDEELLGPKKIVGNLTLGNNVNVTLAGPLWITGDLIMQNGSSVTLDASLGELSSVIMADGTALIENNAELWGSGTAGSFILVVSTLDDDVAIEIANNAEGAVFYATQGGVLLKNNGGAAAIAAERLEIANNAYVNYDEQVGLGNLQLQGTGSGPSGWVKVEQSWIEN